MPTEFVSFFVILFAGIFLSGIFNRLHLPWVAALIIAGVLVGPSGINLFTDSGSIRFIGEIGLVFLMFMAGLETKLSEWKNGIKLKVFSISLIVSLSSFSVGFFIASYFAYDLLSSILMGIIFVSSSVAVIIPVMQTSGLNFTNAGKTIIGTALILDILSLVLLSVLLQNIEPATEFPLPVFYTLLFISLIVLRKIIPKAHSVLKYISRKENIFETDLRLVFVVMLGTVIIFEFLGLHSIVAGFFAGFVLSDSIKTDVIKEKLHAISYGIFIPTFFIVVGASMSADILNTTKEVFLMTLFVTLGLFFVKIFTGYFSAKLCGFNSKNSLLVGVALTPKLSTALAAALAGVGVGIVDENLFTAVVSLSIITTLIVPIIVNSLFPNPSIRKIDKNNL